QRILGLDILTFLIFAPMVGGLIVLLLPRNRPLARWAALAVSVVVGAVSLVAFNTYVQNPGGFRLETQTPWFPLLGASWHVGIDGISAAMVLLTGVLTPLAILISFEIEERVNAHMALLLIFEGATFG